MANTDLQSRLFERLTKSLPAHVSLPNELAELLDISVDSAYRRMRGDTILRLDEVELICQKFGVDLSTLDSGNGRLVQFERELGSGAVQGAFEAVAGILAHTACNSFPCESRNGCGILKYARQV